MRAGPFLAVTVAAVTALATAGVGAMASTNSAGGATGRFDRPQHGFAPADTVLRTGDPSQVGLDPGPLTGAEDVLDAGTRADPATGHPQFSGAVGLYAHDGMIVDQHATGAALRYADRAGHELPPNQQVPMREDTIFDMASISKLFTSIAVMQLVDEGTVDINTPVAAYLPEFATNGKESITVQQLLTHVSGLPAEPEPSLWEGYPDIPSRRMAVLHSTPVNPPGTEYTYSDINLMALGFLVERLTGSSLDSVVQDKITTPLGMADTGYNPPPSAQERIAATEYTQDPPRGLIRGQVHDENAWSLGGVAGHAGVFSTARDMATLGQTILNGGSYSGEQILRADTVRDMLTNYNQAFPDDAHGLGFELNQMWYMGGLATPSSAGHTGFTGTSLVLDPRSRSVAVLLTNRVHPTREWGSINQARETWATGMARALAVRPQHGPDAWFSRAGNRSEATLSTRRLSPHGGPASVRFSAFVDSENTDQLTLESSADGEAWQPVRLRATGPGAPRGEVDALAGSGHRSWWQVRADIPTTEQLMLRWRYRTDANYTGRGVSLDAIRVADQGGTLVDGEGDPDALVPDGWQLRSR